MTKRKENKKKYFIIDKADNLEYIVKVKTNKNGDKVYKLFYSTINFDKMGAICRPTSSCQTSKTG